MLFETQMRPLALIAELYEKESIAVKLLCSRIIQIQAAFKKTFRFLLHIAYSLFQGSRMTTILVFRAQLQLHLPVVHLW